MNREDIIRMAREAGFVIDEASRQYQPKCISFTHYLIDDELSRFASLVAEKATEKANARANKSWSLMCEKMVAAEREACAKVCDDKAMHCETKAQEAIEAGEHDEVSAIRSTAWQISVCAAAMRARGETSSRERS